MNLAAQSTQETPQAELARAFHSALVSTRTRDMTSDLAGELFELTASPEFQAILSAVRDVSASRGVSEAQAAETVIRTFRRLEAIWQEYLIQEGADRLRQLQGN